MVGILENMPKAEPKELTGRGPIGETAVADKYRMRELDALAQMLSVTKGFERKRFKYEEFIALKPRAN